VKKFDPLNRHLLISRKEVEEKNDNTFVLPDDYQKPSDPYEVVKVLSKAIDCTLDVDTNDHVVVERSQVQTVSFEGQEFHIVLQNHVYGVLN
jgi:co-chaperonin GroES (HSP10)